MWCGMQDGGVAGEGYQSRTSPHTKHESFVGLSLSLAQEVSLMCTLYLLYCSLGCLQSACGMVVVVMVNGALLQVYCLASCECLYISRACMVVFLSQLWLLVKRTIFRASWCWQFCDKVLERQLGEFTGWMSSMVRVRQCERAEGIHRRSLSCVACLYYHYHRLAVCRETATVLKAPLTRSTRPLQDSAWKELPRCVAVALLMWLMSKHKHFKRLSRLRPPVAGFSTQVVTQYQDFSSGNALEKPRCSLCPIIRAGLMFPAHGCSRLPQNLSDYLFLKSFTQTDRSVTANRRQLDRHKKQTKMRANRVNTWLCWRQRLHGMSSVDTKAVFDLTNPHSDSDFSDSVNPSIQCTTPNPDSRI